MAESRIKDENYYQVQGWMAKRWAIATTPSSLTSSPKPSVNPGGKESVGQRAFTRCSANTETPYFAVALSDLPATTF